jgi:hypothetical protein
MEPEATPALDAWLAALGIEVVGATGAPGAEALSRDVVIDGERRHDLRVTVAWVNGLGLSLWAYYGLEAMEVPRRVYHRMLRANFEYPHVKFAMTEDDRPMLVTELPPAATSPDELARGLVRLTIVADRLLEETASAVADRGILPERPEREGRNRALLATHRAGLLAEMPPWEPPVPRRRRRSLGAWLRGTR